LIDRLLEKTRLAERDHFWFRGFRQFVAPAIDRAVDGIPSPRLLDCGCGTGANLTLLSRRGRAFGFDLAPVGISFARAAGHDRLARATITEIPFANAAFDVVTSFDVLQCLTEAQETAALGEMARVLKPGGVLVLNVAALEWLRGSHSVLSEETRRYTRPLLRRALRRAGLGVQRLTYTNFSVFPIMVATRLLQRASAAAGRTPKGHDIEVPPAPVNHLLTALLSAEARALRVVNMPIGSSILAVARKP
jgi:ubiquinone/menaquinone biosynthesis C-methylase UbiE